MRQCLVSQSCMTGSRRPVSEPVSVSRPTAFPYTSSSLQVSVCISILSQLYPSYNLCGNAADDAVGRNILCDHRSCGHYRIVPDGHSLGDGGVGAYPDPLAKDDRGRVGVAPVLGSDAVVEGREDHVVPYLAAVPDYHSAVVLEMAAGIDEHILSYSDVLPEVSVQRREYLECRIYRLPEQPREQLPYLVRLVIGAVQLEGYLPRLIAHPVHKFVYLGGVQCFPRLDEIQEFFQFHIVSD